MKLAYSMFSFDAYASLQDIFPLLQKAGYDGVEPVLSESGYLHMGSSVQEVKDIKVLAEACGLEIPSLGVWSLWDNNLVSDTPAIRQRAKDIIKKQLEYASILGADTILVVPGYTSCDFAKVPERIRYDIAYERALEAFGELCEIAKTYRISIGIENVWNKFLLSPIEVKHFFDTIASEYLGMYFDVGNIMYVSYPEDWIAILGKYIKKIHISDYRTSQAGLGAFVDVFAGDVDFYKVMQALKQIGYNDYLTVEMLPNYKTFPEVSIFSQKCAMDRLKELYESIKL